MPDGNYAPSHGSKTVSHPSEWEDRQPGRGSIKPRAYNLDSDAFKLLLDGDWRFRFSPIAHESEDFARTGSSTDGWDSLPVPSHWVLHGDGRYGRPAYQNVQFPFPVDPPFVPDQNPTGDYVRTFALPEDVDVNDGRVSATNPLDKSLRRRSCYALMGSSRGQKYGSTAIVSAP